MAKQESVLEVRCPCCETTLKVDRETGVVLAHQEKVKPKLIEDLQAAVQGLKGEAARREEVFQKSVQDHQAQKHTMDRKFDELLKQAKENPDAPVKRAFDFE